MSLYQKWLTAFSSWFDYKAIYIQIYYNIIPSIFFKKQKKETE